MQKPGLNGKRPRLRRLFKNLLWVTDKRREAAQLARAWFCTATGHLCENIQTRVCQNLLNVMPT